MIPYRVMEAAVETGLDTEELYEQLGIIEKTFFNWLRGTKFISVFSIANLSLVSGLSTDYLVGLSEVKEIPGVHRNKVDLSRQRFSERIGLLYLNSGFQNFHQFEKAANVDDKSLRRALEGEYGITEYCAVKLVTSFNVSLDWLLGFTYCRERSGNNTLADVYINRR